MVKYKIMKKIKKEITKEDIQSKLKLLDVLMYEQMLEFGNILEDATEHDLIYLSMIIDKEVDRYTQRGYKALKNDLEKNKPFSDYRKGTPRNITTYTDGNGY